MRHYSVRFRDGTVIAIDAHHHDDNDGFLLFYDAQNRCTDRVNITDISYMHTDYIEDKK